MNRMRTIDTRATVNPSRPISTFTRLGLVRQNRRAKFFAEPKSHGGPKLPRSPRNATPVPCAFVRRIEPWRVFVANEFTVQISDRMRGAK